MQDKQCGEDDERHSWTMVCGIMLPSATPLVFSVQQWTKGQTSGLGSRDTCQVCSTNSADAYSAQHSTRHTRLHRVLAPVACRCLFLASVFRLSDAPHLPFRHEAVISLAALMMPRSMMKHGFRYWRGRRWFGFRQRYKTWATFRGSVSPFSRNDIHHGNLP